MTLRLAIGWAFYQYLEVQKRGLVSVYLNKYAKHLAFDADGVLSHII